MRMRKKKNLAPRMEACGGWLVADPFAQRGRWHELMPDAKEIRLELGCGKGRFTAETAAAEPDVLLIAVEKVPDAMVVAMERARDAGLKNVFFVDGDAALLPDMFAPDEIDRIYINFCDPWPKSNQAKRRLTHHNFLNQYRKVLKPGGEIHFKTDNDKLFEWSLEEIPQYGWALQLSLLTPYVQVCKRVCTRACFCLRVYCSSENKQSFKCKYNKNNRQYHGKFIFSII